MAQQSVLPEEELARKAGAIKALSLGVLATVGMGEVIAIVIWLFNRDYPVIPFTLVLVAGMLIASVTYWLVRVGKVKAAGYFFVIGLLLEVAIITTLFGGFIGPLAICYLFPILVAGIVISINAGFFIATLAAVLYLVMIPIEQAGLLPQLIAPEAKGAVLPYMTVATRVVFFYLIAFLSWFAASRLNQALQSVRRYASELRTANEKLQASEEELRSANEELRATEEELRASNEELQSTIGELAKANEELRNEITERKRMEGQLIKNAIYIDAMGDALLVLDMQRNVVKANKAASELWSFKLEEITKMTFEQILPQEEHEKHFLEMKKAVETGTVRPFETLIRTKDNKNIQTLMSGTAMKDEKGRPIGFVGVFRDITERKRMEQEIQDKNEQLDAQNEELRAANEELQATEEELRAANEELQAANEELREAQEQLVRSERLAAIGQLAGGVGHELRNPLGAIKNAVYYIKGKVAKSELAQKEPRVMEFLDIMDDEINASNKIISDLLGFSRVGKPSVSPTHIEKVIEAAFSHIPIPENIELTKKLDADLPKIEIDPDQIQQVLVNMIMNAVQAMPEGGKLTIAARQREKFLEVGIADTGCGIPQEAIGKIFDPLFTTRAKGIGLGLAVCKAIIDRHEGHIEVKSEVGKGTTFTIKLPLRAG